MCYLKCLSNADVANKCSIYFKEKGKMNSAKMEIESKKNIEKKYVPKRILGQLVLIVQNTDNEKKLFLKQEIFASYIQQHGNLSRYEPTFQ